MAEWSKAPDSRHMPYSYDRELQREFWSSYEGVGSNPTSDSNFLKNILLDTWQHFKNKNSGEESQ
jgi:hypothetical protein